MGLLDLTEDPVMGLALGLLSASGPSSKPVSLGQALGAGVQNMNEFRQNALKNKLMDMQMKQSQLGIEKGTLELDQFKRQQAALKSISDKITGKTSPAVSEPYGGGYSPGVASAFGLSQSKVNSLPQTGVRGSQGDRYLAIADELDAAGLPDMASKYRESAIKLMPKFKADNGFAINPATGKLEMWVTSDQSGKPEFQGVAPKPSMKSIDLGGKIVYQNEDSILPGTEFKKSMTPDAVASNALGWANYSKPSIQNVEGVGMFGVGPGGTATPITYGGKQIVSDKPLTSDQAGAAGFADRMIKASGVLNSKDLKDYQSPQMGSEALRSTPFIGGALGNYADSSYRQVYRQAQEDWVRSKLRKESGAAIGKDEMQQEIDTYFPKIGDDELVIAQKAQARATAEQAMVRQAGNSYKPPEVQEWTKPVKDKKSSIGKGGWSATKLEGH